mmetsp:Transcript_3296/g.12662  ORF Transcript_3296/g.12662 Transcript_3296/m.12662 type:complete len:286 (-) Transcript_3296:5-862(-)
MRRRREPDQRVDGDGVVRTAEEAARVDSSGGGGIGRSSTPVVVVVVVLSEGRRGVRSQRLTLDFRLCRRSQRRQKGRPQRDGQQRVVSSLLLLRLGQGGALGDEARDAAVERAHGVAHVALHANRRRRSVDVRSIIILEQQLFEEDRRVVVIITKIWRGLDDLEPSEVRVGEASRDGRRDEASDVVEEPRALRADVLDVAAVEDGPPRRGVEDRDVGERERAARLEHARRDAHLGSRVDGGRVARDAALELDRDPRSSARIKRRHRDRRRLVHHRHQRAEPSSGW